MTYRIRTVSEMTGIPRNTLIAWERRYGFVKPERHGNSYRSYSDADVAKLMRVKNAIASGLSVSEAIDQLQESLQAPDLRGAQLVDAAHQDPDPFHELRNRLYDALTNYQGAAAERLFVELMGISGETRIHHVFFPVLRRIGDAWQSGAVSVAQEHYAAALLREQMVSMLIGVGQRRAQGAHAACTSFTGDLHELSALAMAVHLSNLGYRVSYLGPDLPAQEVGTFCRSGHPNLVCVSSILRQRASVVTDYARTLRAAVPEATRLVIGGRGIELTPPPAVAGVEFVPAWDDFDALPDRIAR